VAAKLARFSIGADTVAFPPGGVVIRNVPTGFDTITLTILQSPDAR
jgi:hypothetical protein